MKATYAFNYRRLRVITFISMIVLEGFFLLHAQDTISNGKALNIPFRKFGISFGNSLEFSGIRINYADKDVIRVNGLNLTLWANKLNINRVPNNYNAVVNGLSLGLIPISGSMQPLNIGLIGISAKALNGISFGGLSVHSFNNINGICLSALATEAGKEVNGLSINGLWTESSIISGLAISGLIVGAGEAINGVAFGGLGVASDKKINALAVSVGYIGSKEFSGIGLTPGYLKSGICKGMTIAGYNKSEKLAGISIAVFNKTEELHGVQLGVLNYAANNRKGLRWLPLLNLHLKKE